MLGKRWPLILSAFATVLCSCGPMPAVHGPGTGVGQHAVGNPGGSVSGTPARAGYASGTATFKDGSPIPSFKIRVAGPINLVDGDGANGQYSVPLGASSDAMVYSIRGTVDLMYHGKKWQLPLWPKDNLADDGAENGFRGETRPGVTRDFVLNMSGPVNPYQLKDAPEFIFGSDRGFRYGGELCLSAAYGNTEEDYNGGLKTSVAHLYPPESTIALTLDPVDKRVDGLPGVRIERTFAIGPTASPYMFGIPYCAYTATAVLKEPNGTSHPLRLSLTAKGIGDFGSSVPLEWEPWGSSGEYRNVPKIYMIQ